ncbi:hypothetical protein [Paenibacillus sp. sgz302251]|uniref:hypothetical protein n=1 Tax=Paenibacillus sp. sgz302251 TaxID=3414493 RepID=UPI003C7CD921
MTNLHQSVYIPSIEASDIHLHNHHNQPLYIRHVGMIPTSLELESLFRHGFNVLPSGKRISNDVINISFKTAVIPVVDKIKKLNTKLSDIEKQLIKYTDKLPLANGKKEEERIKQKIETRSNSIKKVKSVIEELKTMHWDEMGIDDLRYAIYENGFFIEYNDKNGNVEKVEYLISSRSSAKSRIGKVLAIRKELYEDMKQWRRMGLDLDGRSDVDFVSILAYESLMGSSIIDTLEIHPENILIIDDYVDTFSRKANLVSVDEQTGLLVNNEGMGEFANTIWDGQALLSEDYFTDTDKSMKLLRQHWFKAAAFRTDIQQFMKDRAKELEVDYETWLLEDTYGNEILAKNVHMITTPSALKFQKIAHVVGEKKDMYSHWKGKVIEEGNLFGVVKTEKPTKLGYTECGQPIHQMSYQYLNSLPLSFDDLKELSEFELAYINKLKNDDATFIDYLISKADMTNGNDMMVALYRHNNDITGTIMWRNWKSDMISEYVKRVKTGKLKIPNADYMVLLSNPIEMLYASINEFAGATMALRDKQVYCKAFTWGKEVIGMRSPHTSASNVLFSVNTYHKKIEVYMPNLSNNIVVINNIGATTFERLNGADADSDAMWMSDNPTLTKVAKDCDEQYLVCKADNIGTKPNEYSVCNKDMADIDNKLNNDYIGKVTNIAALLCSHIWDAKAKREDITDMLDKLSVLSIVQGLVIDYAKRIPSVSISQILADANKLLKQLLGEEKAIPVWWAIRNKDVVKQYSDKKVNTVNFDCPMDYLQTIFSGLPNADRKDDKNIKLFIRKLKAGKANNKQKHIINELLDDANNKIRSSHKKGADKEQKREIHVDQLDTMKTAKELIEKIKINEDTMYAIIQNIVSNKVDNNTIKSFNMLYQAKKTLFINNFVKK